MNEPVVAQTIFLPLEENDPIFKRGAVCFNPYSVRDSLKSRRDSSKPEAPKITKKKAQKGWRALPSKSATWKFRQTRSDLIGKEKEDNDKTQGKHGRKWENWSSENRCARKKKSKALDEIYLCRDLLGQEPLIIDGMAILERHSDLIAVARATGRATAPWATTSSM